MNEPDLTSVIMERSSLDGIPLYPLEPPMRIRSYTPGDAQHWLEIHHDADPYFKNGRFEKAFGSDEAELLRRQHYLCDGDTVVGTSTAWYDQGYKDGTWGLVHYVAIRRTYQGRGFSKPLLAWTLRTLGDTGHVKCLLRTQRARKVAIRLYESFGFVEVQ